MPNLTEESLLAFRDELAKVAAPNVGALVQRFKPALRNIGSAGGVGATLGALGGAGIGAVGEYRDARAEGASAGAALGRAAGGALRGGARGGALGAIAGGGVGALAGRDLSGLAARDGLVGAGARFGQRQVHGLTGMLNPAELEGVRGGAHDARRALATAKPAAKGDAARALSATEDAQTMGLTSLPGYLRAISDKQIGVRKALGTSLKSQWYGQPRTLAALTVALPAAGAAGALGGARELDDQGRGRFERALGGAADAAGGVATGAMPLGTGALLGGALGRAGRLAGRGVDRLRGVRPQVSAPPPPEAASGQHVPSERITSPAAAGHAPEIAS